MESEIIKVIVKDLAENYVDNGAEGVFALNGRLCVRPSYQREFIYNDKKRQAVIDTIRKGYSLNLFYWNKDKNENGDDIYELIDGQQRTISVCQFINGEYSVPINGDSNDISYFDDLTAEEKERILNYELLTEVTTGSEREKLAWFERINTAGDPLTKQELRNAVYTGTWLSDAKDFFSKRGCPAQKVGRYGDANTSLIKGSADRQEILETALTWIADRDNVSIEQYMADHRNDKNANELRQYYTQVMNWVKMLFLKYRKEMKGQKWGLLYNEYKDKTYDIDELEKRINSLMLNDEVTRKSGIYPFLVTGKEKYLSLRAFSTSQKSEMYERQNGECSKCRQHFDIDDMEADHIEPWSRGGKTEIRNGQLLCRKCNREKSDK